MTTQRIKVTLQVFHWVDTADYPDEEAEVGEGEEQPNMSIDEAVASFKEALDDEPDEFLEQWYTNDDIEVVKVE